MSAELEELRGARSGPGGAISDVFLDISTRRAGKIKGESTTAGHVEDIDILGWRWGVAANTAIGATQATARRVYRHLELSKGVDSASTMLMNALVTNDEVREAKLTMRKAGGDALDYFTMTLNGARIVDVAVEVGADGRPVEKVELAFTKVEIDYRRQERDGSGGASFSFADEILAAG
jgi:type VI secretion system secreted protein Hcp